ncbi:hypothetical protein DNTS_033202, partial [Danionella cerebrum]
FDELLCTSLVFVRALFYSICVTEATHKAKTGLHQVFKAKSVKMIHLIRITAFLRRDHADQDEESKQRDGELHGVEEVESSSEAPPGISKCSDMFSCERSLRFAASPGVFNYRPNCTNYPPDVFSAGFRFLSGPFRTYRAPAAVYCTGLESRYALPALYQDAVGRDQVEPGCSKEVEPRPSQPAVEQKKKIWNGELHGVEEVESSSEAPPGISSCSDMFSCERSLRFAASPGVFNYRPNPTNYPPDVFSAGFRFLSGPFRTYRAPAAVYCTGLESRDALPALCQDAVDRDRAEPGCSKEDSLALQSLRPVKITNFEVLQAVGPRPSRPALEQKKTIWKINFVEYEMGALLGRGRSGTEVLEAVRLEDGLQVAVKIVPWHTFYFLLLDHDVIVPKEVVLHLAVDQEPRFSEIIQLLDWDVTHMGCIMVLEHPMHSQPLDEFIISYRGSFPEDLAQVIMRQVVTAAQVCCQRLVFHKDIKLENLLINPKTLKVKLIDFGSGEILMSGGYETFEGTMEYCPPEYLTVGRYCGEPATVWSLGILSYVMLRLKFPRNQINFVEYEMGALLGRGRSGTEVLEAVRLEDGLQDHDVIVPKEVVLHLAVDQEPRFSEIIQLLDWDVTHMGCIMVLERPMHSQPLDEFIISYRDSFPEDLAQVIMRQVVTAAQVCCQRLVFHKDIKLENLLIDPKTLKNGGYETFEGTMEYCPPEYLTVGRYCGEPATVWSLGILSYVMLRLKFPRNRHLKKLDEGTWRKRRLSMECHDFLHRCLQTEPSNRLQLDEVLLHPWFNDHSSHFYLDSDDSFSSDTSIEEIGHSRSFQMSWRTHTSWKTEQLLSPSDDVPSRTSPTT